MNDRDDEIRGNAFRLPGRSVCVHPGSSNPVTVVWRSPVSGTVAVEVRVQDPGGRFATDSFTWTITNTNRAPAFSQDLGDRTTAEGAAVSLATPATDPEGGGVG